MRFPKSQKWFQLKIKHMSRLRKQTKQSIKSFREMLGQGRLYLWMFITSIFLWLVMFALLWWRIVPLSVENPFLPLHYNVYFGVDRFGPWYQVFSLPALGLLFLVVNVVMQTHFFRREKMLARFFAISSVFLEVVLLVATSLIVLLNI